MNFSNIPKDLNVAILEAFEAISTEYADNELSYSEVEPQRVNHTGYDGFMPYSNGGYDLMMPTNLNQVWGSGTYPEHEPTRIEIDKTIDDALKDALKAFCEQNTEALAKHFTPEQIEKANNDDINYHDLYNKSDGYLAERLSEFETEYLEEGGTFWYQLRALYFNADNYHNESGEDEVYFMAGTNTDYEYGRENGFNLSFEQTVKIKDLTVDSIGKLVKKMANTI